MRQGARETLSGRWALPFLGIACAVGVGSIYYNQPLLMVMGKSLGQGARAMGFVAVATQVGYAAGLLLFVPLGDVAERRTLMMRMYAGAALALALAGMAQGLAWMIAASVLIGLMASVTHVALPMAPDLVPEERRGQAIGTVMTGLLLGILLARSFAGWLSRLNGWRTVLFIAAVMNAAFVPFIYRAMPKMRPRQSMSYRDAMRSLWTLFRTEPLLREAGTVGALVFGSFSCFWTTLTFLLQAHYNMGPGVAGTFGVVGAAGAMVAPLAGRLADRRGTRYVVTAAGAVLAASYVWLWLTERVHSSVAVHMLGLVIGVVVLDVGAQMMQVANQTRIFGLGAEARSRLNTIYMTMYFVGGAVGSALASLAWARWQWNGVCALEVCLIAAAGLRHVTGFSKGHPQPVVHVPASEREPV
ncbi:MAG TPA: MFS transporter [Acidobacteriaceae bacterium]|jgi:predicted MFS family arabinose efflux permease|nr:MFS transporter [Acidobacteriaceae bacterium]